ncbi:MAG: FAD:protein FMN transferase [Anaerolineales bacterium]|nr:FAD:protein FMN transferase [Anaerolineales bacterium]
MDLVDKTLSRFNPESELSRLNEYTVIPPVVSRLLWDALDWALTAAEITDRLYDPTVLNALLDAGYDRDFSELQQEQSGLPVLSMLPDPFMLHNEPGRGSEVGGWRLVERDPVDRTVALPSILKLDLGGTAKGWAADRALQMLAPLGPSLVNAGGDVAVSGSYPDDTGWKIGIRVPYGYPGSDHMKGPLAVLQTGTCGIATSGIDYRWWNHKGSRNHHLIDPSTQQPAVTDLLSASVIAPDVARADLFASVVMILGMEQGAAFLEAHTDFEGLLVGMDGTCWQSSGLHSILYEPVRELAKEKV